jgi:hypothetical protein
MIDATPRQLPQGWPVEGRTGTALPGWKGILFALPFLAIGVVLALLVATNRVRSEAPRGALYGFAAIFAASALQFIQRSVRSIVRERRWARLRALGDPAPWRSEFPWDRRGSIGDSGRVFGAALFALAGMSAFLVPFAWLAFSPLRGLDSWAFRGSIAFFGLFLAGLAGWVAYLLARRLKYGPGFLRFGHFPFLLGEAADLRLEPPRHARGLRRLEVALRCVEERIERQRDREGEHAFVSRWQLWAETRTVDADLGGSGLELSFALPADPALGTRLSAESPRYWELVARGAAPGVDYASAFLVPVYAAPGESRDGVATG